MRFLGTENLSLKIWSLVLAILLKTYFLSPDNLKIESIDLPVVITDVPRSLVLVSPVDHKSLTITAKLRAPSTLIEQYRNDENNIQVRMPYLVPSSGGEVRSRIKVRDYLPNKANVEILDVTPAELELVFERRVRKELPVQVNTKGEPAPGYRVEHIKVTPESVIVDGPAREVESLSTLNTQEIDISSLMAPQKMDVPLIDQGTLTNFGVNLVSIDITISPVVTDKTFNNVPIHVIAPEGAAATVEPTKATVVVSGAAKAIEVIDEGQLSLVADAKGLPAGEHSVELSLDQAKISRGIRLIDTNPRKAVVRLVEKHE